MKKKIIVSAIAIVLVLCCAIGGTLAWLTDATTPIVNTFTVGNVGIGLTETTEDYKMIPGKTLAKDPMVTVEAGSEACYLFVKVEETMPTVENPAGGNYAFSDYLDYDVASSWTPVDGYTGLYVYTGEDTTPDAVSADSEYYILDGNKVHVLDSVTNEMLNAVSDEGSRIQLTFTAYAIQSDEIEYADALAEVLELADLNA